MPVGLKFQRKHRFLGYKLKYIYYFIARRNILQKKKSYGKCNADKVIYIIKPDYQDGVEGLLSLIHKQVIYIEYAKKNGYIPFVDWKNYKTQYYDGKIMFGIIFLNSLLILKKRKFTIVKMFICPVGR